MKSTRGRGRTANTTQHLQNYIIAFLDVLITIKEDFSLGFTVYRKKTHTDRYLHFTSNHIMHHKISVIDSLVTRALRICDPEKIEEELHHITKALHRNCYPVKIIKSRIEHHKSCINNPKQVKDDEFIKRIVLPYTGRVTTQVANIIRSKTNLEVAFKPINKISTSLSNNNSLSSDQIRVYKFPCHTCRKIYVGESGRNLTIRASEHLRDIRNAKDTSGPYCHIRDNPSHHFDVTDIQLIDRERNKYIRKFKESIYIGKSVTYNCNLENGMFINPIWSATVSKFFKSP